MKEIEIAIQGMDCAACAGTLERLLKRAPGVAQAEVHYSAASAKLVYDDTALSPADLVGLVRRTGFRVPQEEADIRLPESADKAAVLTALQAVSGVASVKERSDGKLLVTFWPVGVDGDTLVSACRGAGVEAEITALRGGEEYHRLDARMRLLRTLLSAAGLTAPLMLEPHPKLQFALGTALQLGPGRHFLSGALRDLRSGIFGMDLLVSLSSSIIYLYSSFVALTRKKNFTLYFTSQGVLLSLILFGKYMEQVAAGEAGAAIRKLLRLQPRTAMVRSGDAWVETDIDRICPGDQILLRPGERVPVDGVVLEGTCAVDESMLTGESVPVDKTVGDTLVGGSMNRAGSVTLAATTLGKDSVLQHIVDLVRRAQTEKAPVQRFADSVAQWFVPAVIGSAAGTFALWFLKLKKGNLEAAILNCCDVLTVACPCALGLATPTALMVGSSAGAEQGVLFRSGAELERAWKADTVVFDKTGTLTQGELRVTDVLPLPGTTEQTLISLCAALETRSEHPISRAVTAYAKETYPKLPELRVKSFAAIPARGVSGMVDGKLLLCGNRELLREHGVSMTIPENVRAQGKTELCAAYDGRLLGVIAVADVVRPDAAETVHALQAAGKEVWMMTGDHVETAHAIARSVGIEHVMAQTLPEDKARRIQQLQAQGKTVCMVGDGVNDTPALAAADVAVAMGTGADIAIESAGVLLPSAKLDRLLRGMEVSRKTVRVIRQNLRWALGYNALSIPLAASGLMHPSLCAAAMSCSSIGVLLNSLRLRSAGDRKGRRRN